jgi:hypothetical protein
MKAMIAVAAGQVVAIGIFNPGLSVSLSMEPDEDTTITEVELPDEDFDQPERLLRHLERLGADVAKTEGQR